VNSGNWSTPRATSSGTLSSRHVSEFESGPRRGRVDRGIAVTSAQLKQIDDNKCRIPWDADTGWSRHRNRRSGRSARTLTSTHASHLVVKIGEREVRESRRSFQARGVLNSAGVRWGARIVTMQLLYLPSSTMPQLVRLSRTTERIDRARRQLGASSRYRRAIVSAPSSIRREPGTLRADSATSRFPS